jgi:hypothetical protein
VWRLPDGTLVVANDQIELRFFDKHGKYLRTVGQRGSGPGEYQQLLSLWRGPGDSLRVYDVPTSRIDVRTYDGKLVRSFAIPRTSQLAWLPNGGAIFSRAAIPDLRTPGVRQASLLLELMRPDATSSGPVAELPGSWLEISRDRAWRGVDLAGAPMLWGGVGGAVFVHGDRLAIHWFSSEGRLIAITRVSLPRLAVGSADVRAQEAVKTGQRATQQRLGVEGGQLPSTYAQFLPQATRVRLDSEGLAWIRRWPAWGAAVTEWIVFAPRGFPIARVDIPTRLLVHDIGPDYVLGISTDDDGVQSIQRYRLRRSASADRKRPP